MKMHVSFYYTEDSERPIFTAVFDDYDYTNEVVKGDEIDVFQSVLVGKMTKNDKAYFKNNFQEGVFKILRSEISTGLSKYDVTPKN